MSHPLGIFPEPAVPPVLSLGGYLPLTRADRDPRLAICSLWLIFGQLFASVCWFSQLWSEGAV